MTAVEDRRREFLKRYGNEYDHMGEFTGRLDVLRETEFSRFKDVIYLDHTGSGVYQRSQLTDIFHQLEANVYGNPHSVSRIAQRTQQLIDKVRLEILEFFHTSEDDYDVIFTHNATAAIKLVGELFPWTEDSTFAYTRCNHTSVLGIREYAAQAGATVHCVSDYHHNYSSSSSTLESFLLQQQHPSTSGGSSSSARLFAFPAEDNFSGRRFPLQRLISLAQQASWRVLLDVACYVAHAEVNLSELRPDFVPVSFYKMFGYPTGLGALLLRRPIGYTFQKVYFGGGSILECSTGFCSSSSSVSASRRGCHLLKELPDRLEDGTVDFLSIVAAIPRGLACLRALTLPGVARHTLALAAYLAGSLHELTHSNGRPVCEIYGNHFPPPPPSNPPLTTTPPTTTTIESSSSSSSSSSSVSSSAAAASLQGPIVTFNVLRPDGRYYGLSEVVDGLNDQRIECRVGVMCNPGSCCEQVGISEEAIEARLSKPPPSNGAEDDAVMDQHSCGADEWVEGGKPLGAVRISIGYMNSFEDVDQVYLAISGNWKR